jgi:hypothetical protein
MSNIEDKIKDITNVSQYQKDRMMYKDQVYDTLLSFLQSYAMQSIAQSDLESKLDEDLLNALQNTDPESENKLTNYEKIKLKEILSKEKTDLKGNLIKALIEGTKNSNNSKNNNDTYTGGNEGEDPLVTQEELNSAIKVSKKLNSLFKELEIAESSEEEIISKK